MSSRKLTVDLHSVYNKGADIDRILNEVFVEAVEKRIAVVEIIPGKGTGQLKKRVLRFLKRKDNKLKYHRIKKDPRNSGRLFVHFRSSNLS